MHCFHFLRVWFSFQEHKNQHNLPIRFIWHADSPCKIQSELVTIYSSLKQETMPTFIVLSVFFLFVLLSFTFSVFLFLLHFILHWKFKKKLILNVWVTEIWLVTGVCVHWNLGWNCKLIIFECFIEHFPKTKMVLKNFFFINTKSDTFWTENTKEKTTDIIPIVYIL